MDKPLLPPPLDLSSQSLFLDYDGTLVEIAPTPAEAVADPQLLALLAELRKGVGGALAIVTGRPVMDIDGFLAPLRLPMAALHGLAVRGHDGSVMEPAGAAAAIEPVRNAVALFAGKHPGTRMEDKGLSIALHYRGAPAAGTAAEELAMRLAEASEGVLRVQRGKMVVEVLPAGTDKGTAIAALMRDAPFRARRPVFVGDDVTDEAGFVAVNTLDGVSIGVGQGKTAARHQIPDVTSLRAWLAGAVAS